MDVALLTLGIITVLLLIAVLAFTLRRSAVVSSMPAAESGVREDLRLLALELRQELSTQRTELSTQLGREREERQQASLDLRTEVAASISKLVEQSGLSASAAREADDRLRTTMVEELAALRSGNESKLEQIRVSVDEKLRDTLAGSLKENSTRIEALTVSNSEKQDGLQRSIREELEKMRAGNEAKLEKMRETVDEKLQGTLERRLGESFALVSQRLEQVQKGLGEMQTLATDVGGLKRVLTNVKNRGSWGEVQLSRQLEDLLTDDQYDENVAVRPGSAERVEFAVRLPGRDDDGTPVYLPIDSKFPQEDYERLLDAQESGDTAAIEDAGKQVERAIIEQAKTIAKKYIEPPHTTDFAILYLPTEGLFAEVVRRPGLASRLQADHRIMITGPTTLMSILNSLQMGFRTLAIEKRSSEVWQVLAAAKTEFHKYGQVWDKLQRQLQTAQKTVEEAGVRTRAVERKLRSVETLEVEAFSVDELVELPETASAVDDFEAVNQTGIGRDEIDDRLVTPVSPEAYVEERTA